MRIFISHQIKIGNRTIWSVMAIAALLILTACTEQSRKLAQPGDVFPINALSADNLLHGEHLALDEKILLINFWATWCTPCRKEMPDLQELSEQLDKNRITVIGVSIDEDKNLAKEFLLQHGIRFPHYLDKNQHIALTQLGISAFPETFIVSSNGKIIKRITGEQNWNRGYLKQLLSQASQTLDSYEIQQPVESS